MRRYITLTTMLFILWLGLTASLQWQELATGLVASLVIAWASLKIAANSPQTEMKFKNWLLFIPTLFWEIIKANVEITKLVLAPKIKINPGFVTIKTDCTSDRKKWLLAHAITLTPGTVTADIIDDKLLVHWIDIKGNDIDEQGRIIKEKFEKVLH